MDLQTADGRKGWLKVSPSLSVVVIIIILIIVIMVVVTIRKTETIELMRSVVWRLYRQ